MKNSIELKEMRSDFISKLEVLKKTAELEDRDLTQDENTEMDSVLQKVDEMDVKIKRAERAEEALKTAAMVSGTKIEAGALLVSLVANKAPSNDAAILAAILRLIAASNPAFCAIASALI